MGTSGYMPCMECPGCCRPWQWDDYYDVHAGSERECPHCGVLVIVDTVDHVVHATLEVKGFEKRAVSAGAEPE